MNASVRNQGQAGLAAMAVAAVDGALWDLKGRLLDVPVVQLLGAARRRVRVYGSGGFTSYSEGELARQLSEWAEGGLNLVKMKIGRAPDADFGRVSVARAAVGERAMLMVDANGAYSPKQALGVARACADQGVVWFEEPVSSNDLEGLRFLRHHVPAPIEVAAGEYGSGPRYFRRMLAAGAVDVLQADASRCGGVTGIMAADALAQAFETPLSAHCAPALHVHPCCAAKSVRHLEWFHDHVRIERMLFDGVPRLSDGEIEPPLDRPGLGIEFRRADAARFQVGGWP